MTTSHRNNAATSYDVMFTEYLYAAFHRKEDTRNDLCYIVISSVTLATARNYLMALRIPDFDVLFE